jgi:hypothetical protein
MNRTFRLENEKSWKTLYVTADKVQLINKSYSTPGEFEKGFSDEGIGRLLKSKKEISVMNITGLQHAEKDPKELTILHEGKKEKLNFASSDDLREVTGYLSAVNKLSSQTEQVNTFKAIQSPLIGLGLTLVFGYLLFTEAQTIAEGGVIEITGRKRGFKRLMVWLAETLGTTGVLVCASAAAVACIFFIYKNMKAPPNQVTYA